MHGVNRDAEAEFRRNVPLDHAKHNLRPEKHNFVLLVPEFSEELFPSRNNYNFGGIFQVTRHSLFHIFISLPCTKPPSQPLSAHSISIESVAMLCRPRD
jgi:hypothetical protein